MITQSDIERTTFVRLSTILDNIVETFPSFDRDELLEEIGDHAPWTWGDINRVLVDCFDVMEFLDNLMVDYATDYDNVMEVGDYCDDLRTFLRNNNVYYIDVAN